MADERKTTLAIPMTLRDRERLKEKAQHIGLSPASYARVLIKRELNASEPVAA